MSDLGVVKYLRKPATKLDLLPWTAKGPFVQSKLSQMAPLRAFLCFARVRWRNRPPDNVGESVTNARTNKSVTTQSRNYRLKV
ncbi:hypothetical protein [Nostoc sp. UIC 10630]|uniref:hypothetical protein n=1 Tax=Nostoc sp. UIC 10630 TaxID=2100146 RepID=UPI0013D8D75D|nr:hypothetical protein [Nostoc sp. UIC 10630]NEU81332.1 hypothetical protein [Nostoc sp. UIC 10630]